MHVSDRINTVRCFSNGNMKTLDTLVMCLTKYIMILRQINQGPPLTNDEYLEKLPRGICLLDTNESGRAT